MSVQQRKDDLFSNHNGSARLLSLASERLSRSELTKKCDQLESEILWWVGRCQWAHELLGKEQDNTSHWENHCYKFQFQTLEQQKVIKKQQGKIEALERLVKKLESKGDISNQEARRFGPRLF